MANTVEHARRLRVSPNGSRMMANPPTRRPARRKAAGSRVALYALAAAVVAVVAVLGVVVLTGDDDDSAPSVASDEPGVAHVHGLGVNPADGSILVATHYGSFRLAGDAPAEGVGDS
jgi:hypothetical protein